MKMANKSKSGIAFDVINCLFIGIFSIICIYPFYYIIIYSISNPTHDLTRMYLLPSGFSLVTFRNILKSQDIPAAFLISVFRVIAGTAITLFCCSFFAYLVSKKKMYFRSIVYRFLILTMYLNAGLIPWYLTMKQYGFKNNILLYIIPSALSAFYVILLKTFIENLPPALEESAEIDGAGIFRSYAQIVMPISMPILATIAIYTSVGQWNSWQDNYFLISDLKLQTLQIILYNYLNQASKFQSITAQDAGSLSNAAMITPTTVKMAITVITVLPIMCVYPFFQKYFVKGILLGAVKG